jgi:hypothetical protein
LNEAIDHYQRDLKDRPYPRPEGIKTASTRSRIQPREASIPSVSWTNRRYASWSAVDFSHRWRAVGNSPLRRST